MTSNSSFVDGTGRRRRTAVIVIAAACTLVLIGAITAVILFVNRGDGTAAATPKPNATANVPTGPLTQIKGERTVDGVAVGYPHTAAGAVSAAAEYTAQIGSTLDLDRARAVAKVIGDPSFTTIEEEAVAGRKNSRKSLGVAEDGPVPPGVSTTVGPAAYQLRSVSEDRMTVLLLCYFTNVDSQGTITPKVIVMPADMHWADGDWKLLPKGPFSDADLSALVAQPNTADAAAKGWQVITL